MFFRPIFCFLVMTTVIAMTISQSQAATVGLWLFEELLDANPTESDGERVFDSSGNELHFTKSGKNGYLELSSDVPPGAPANSNSLDFTAAAQTDTPSTDLLSIGKTGQITIEFWYKTQLTDTVRRIMAQENYYPDGPWHWWSLAQALPNPFPGTASPIDFYTARPPREGTTEVFHEARYKSEDSFLDQNHEQWIHIATTVDGSGTMRMYRDGVLEDEKTGYDSFEPQTSTLRLGSNNPAGGRTGDFLIDDLRISDVALLPGNGTGVDELAWNTSLSVSQNWHHPTLMGDANNDDQVTGGDLIAVQQNFGSDYTNGTCDGMGLGDANDDCLVTGADLISVQQNFGNLIGPPALPEPTTALLLGVFTFVLGRRPADTHNSA